jgi:hypothetical protein
MVVDSSGVYYVIWEDQFSGWVYTKGDGTEWTLRPRISLGKQEIQLRLKCHLSPSSHPDPEGVHPCAMDSADNILYYSRVPAQNQLIPFLA